MIRSHSRALRFFGQLICQMTCWRMPSKCQDKTLTRMNLKQTELRSPKTLKNIWTRSGSHHGTFSLESLSVATLSMRKTDSFTSPLSITKSLSLFIKHPEHHGNQNGVSELPTLLIEICDKEFESFQTIF